MLCRFLCRLADGSERSLAYDTEERGSERILRLPLARIPADAVCLDVRIDTMSAAADEAGYIACSCHPGVGDVLWPFSARADAEWEFPTPLMPLHGLKKDGFCASVFVTSGNLDLTHVIRVRENVWSVFARIRPETPFYEDVVVHYTELIGENADYSGMARAYRSYLLTSGLVRPLKERAAESPALAYACGSVYVRVRQAWKPAPSPIPEQTPETEPPMHTAVTFERAGELLEEMNRQGVEKAELCLVGWNRKGHDGRYPQLFPVEPELGGEEKLRALISLAHRLGYAIDCHTNSTDAYTVAEGLDRGELMLDADGKESVDRYAWSGGRMYHLCPEAGLRHAREDFPKVAALGFAGLHYVDVIGSEWVRTCWSKAHPQTRRDTAMNWLAIMREAKKAFGGASCEGCLDYIAPEQDFGLFQSRNVMGPLPEGAARHVPLWNLVYHGIVMANPSGETLNYAVKTWRERLKCLEYGGRPAIYFHLSFTGSKRSEDHTFCCGSEAELREGAANVKRTAEDYAQVCHLQTVFMLRHEELAPNVYRTSYENGEAIVTNYREEVFVYQGKRVPAHGYLLTKACM